MLAKPTSFHGTASLDYQRRALQAFDSTLSLIVAIPQRLRRAPLTPEASEKESQPHG